MLQYKKGYFCPNCGHITKTVKIIRNYKITVWIEARNGTVKEISRDAEYLKGQVICMVCGEEFPDVILTKFIVSYVKIGNFLLILQYDLYTVDKLLKVGFVCI